jgi:hypothetical protein
MWTCSRLVAVVVLMGSVVAAGCGTLSSGDAERLAQVQERYAARYEFSVEDELYLQVRARRGVRVDSADAEHIFRDFFSVPESRQKSSIVYLNFYDDRGRFLYQLAYDPIAHRVIRGRTEAY